MSSQASFGTSLLFQSMNDELNASLATADELSREFSSMLKEASSDEKSTSGSQTSSPYSYEKPQISTPSYSRESSGSHSSSSSQPFSPSPSSFNPSDSVFSNSLTVPKTTVHPSSPLSSPKINRRSPLPQTGNDGYSHIPQQPPRSPRLSPSSRFDRSSQGLISPHERSPSPNPAANHSPRSPSYHPTSHHLSPYDNSSLGRRSPRPDRSPSRMAANPISSTLPRNFGYRTTDEAVQRQKSPSKWNETDLDVSYERKPHHTYDKTEWVRQSVPNSSWRESNLDGPPPSPSPKKDPRSKPLHYVHASLPRNTRISVPPDVSSPVHSPYHPQPIISRISIPPTSSQSRQHKPIPLSVIMRLQNPRWGAMIDRHPRALRGEGDRGPCNPPPPIPRDFFHQPVVLPNQRPAELRQPTIYSDALNPGDIDAEIERLDFVQTLPVISENPNMPEANTEDNQSPSTAPRPLSPTRLQPVVAPEAQTQVVADMEELLRIRAEIPRALKRRGSIDLGSQKRASHYQPNQYKNLIDKLFRKKEHGHKGEQRGDQSSDTSSSSDGEETPAMPPAPPPSSQTSRIPHSYHSILRQSNRERKTSGKRARLSPLVLALDGSLVGELETVQKAIQEMSDPSHPNDEGITALHNAICGGHYSVVDFLVRIGANVSAPDSHGWTPLHCAASCNDRPLCEFLVRNGAAVMAVTESDTATASQKCDPFAVGFEECEGFLKGVEEAMGVENSGVLYALWSYPAQAPDELSFKDGDMVTILQKPEGSDWWWASLCGREGFVPNNYFGLFPKTRPKSLC